MRYAIGKAQPYESLTPQDYEFFLIWRAALASEGVPGQDETWREPFLSAKDVEKEMVAVYVPFDVIGMNLMGVALYNTRWQPPPSVPSTRQDELGEVTLWWENRWVWVGGNEGPNLTWPLKVQVRPSIQGDKAVCFSIRKSDGVVGTRYEP